MQQVLLRYPVPQESFFSIAIPKGSEIFGVFHQCGKPVLGAIVVLVDPEESSAEHVDFFQVPANEPFDAEGLTFVGDLGCEKFVWMKARRRSYNGIPERALQ